MSGLNTPGLAIAQNTVATVHYTGTLAGTDERFDSSEGSDPLEFLVGHGNMIPGFERNLLGKVAGERVVFTLGPNEAYGDYDDEATQRVPRAQMPQDVAVGAQLAAQTQDGQVVLVRVAAIEGDEVVVDFNHELAGKSLTFSIQVLGVRAATSEEVAHGHTHGAHGYDHHGYDHGHHHDHDGYGGGAHDDCCDD
ncbi:MAG: peptidylprolyl isomerase [Deltaproteobacteria bacterium]|nr:peptidylprolyl isomerase [Deltaproteobacteria bacterium]